MSAQLEDGFTRIANEILESAYKTKFNGTQFSIILFVLRNTYGFQRKSHDMSLSFISTGIDTHKDQVKRELDKLIDWKIITVFQEASFNKTRVIGINKNTEDWDVQSSDKSIQSANKSTASELVGEQSANKSTPTVDGLAHQERKSFKEIKDSHEEEKAMTPMDAYYHSFKRWNYTGQIQGYISELMKRGFTDSFVTEVFLAMGEFGANPDVNYMRKVSEDWISKGIYTLTEAKSRREGEKKKVSVNQPSNQAPKEHVPDPEILRELREQRELRGLREAN